MENITLGEIAVALAFLAGMIVSGGVIVGFMKKALNKILDAKFDEKLKGIEARLGALETKIGEVDLEACKNFLVTFLSDVERGKEISEIERERFWEQYGHYTKCGGNSYIKTKVEKLRAAGKL